MCHSCDNPPCVNPDHLFLGTQKENIADKLRKKREARGSRTGRAKLTEQQVAEIRFIFRTGRFTQKELASKYAVNRGTIIKALHGDTWSHVDDPVMKMSPKEIALRAHTIWHEYDPL